MSLSEMKESVKKLTSAELEELALHVEFFRQTGDPVWREEMLRRASAKVGWHSEEEVIAHYERRVAEED
jgi:hypothetical protein